MMKRKYPKSWHLSYSEKLSSDDIFFKHTCEYNDLKSMFYVFSIWEGDKCLSWDETVLWCGLLGLETVPVIFDGKYDKNEILDSFSKYQKNNNVEGFVVRLKDSFDISDFSISLNKYVKKSFILPSQHWRYAQKTMNKLSNGKNPWEII